MTLRQIVMFPTEDLPLFSGTAPRGRMEPLERQAEAEAYLPPECEFCRVSRLVGLCLFADSSCCWREEGPAIAGLGEGAESRE